MGKPWMSSEIFSFTIVKANIRDVSTICHHPFVIKNTFWQFEIAMEHGTFDDLAV
jgi:hypothetical protein